MNPRLLTLVFVILLSVCTFSHSEPSMAPAITIRFAGTHAVTSAAVALDSVRITNLGNLEELIVAGNHPFVISTPTGIDAGIPRTVDMDLSANFVNPFSRETHVDCSTSQPGIVALELFDALGRHLTSRREQVGTGRHRFRINGERLAPGVYYLSASNGSSRRVIAMAKLGPGTSLEATIAYLGLNGAISRSDHGMRVTATEGADMYRFIAYAAGFKPDTITFSPTGDTLATFIMRPVQLPVLRTLAATGITISSAASGGEIHSDGGSAITRRGVCWSTQPVPTISGWHSIDGTGSGTYTSMLTELASNIQYYVRAYATNADGTGYGEVVPVKTLFDSTAAVTDIDGNQYHSVRIGTQVWLLENLRVTRYRNGAPISRITDPAVWYTHKNEAYTDYDNNPDNGIPYGRLYNFYAAGQDLQITPEGWHIPTDAEWQTLIDYLGGDAVAGGKLKDASVKHWKSANIGATNESGFTALPGGRRHYDGTFVGKGISTIFWSTSANHSNTAWTRALTFDYAGVYYDNDDKRCGLAVRCLKD